MRLVANERPRNEWSYTVIAQVSACLTIAVPIVQRSRTRLQPAGRERSVRNQLPKGSLVSCSPLLKRASSFGRELSPSCLPLPLICIDFVLISAKQTAVKFKVIRRFPNQRFKLSFDLIVVFLDWPYLFCNCRVLFPSKEF